MILPATRVAFAFFIVGLAFDAGFSRKSVQLEQTVAPSFKGNTVVFTGEGSLDSLPEQITSCDQVIVIGAINIPFGKFQDLGNIKQINLDDRVTLEGRCLQRTGITSFVFPLAQNTIPEGIFDGCTSLTSIIFPSDCTSIGSWTFNGISNNIDFYYYGTVKPSSIGDLAEKSHMRVHCSKLTETFIEGTASQDNIISGEMNFYFGTYIFTTDGASHIRMTGSLSHPLWLAQLYRSPPTPTTTIVIHSDSLTLENRWFSQAPKPTSLVLENSGSISFKGYSFTDSTTIKSIKFQGTGTYNFDARAMQGSSVEYAEFGERVGRVGEAMFDTCRQLTTVKILGSVEFQRWCFNKCPSLVNFIYCGNTATSAYESPGLFGGEPGTPAAPFEAAMVPYDFVGTDFYGKGINKTANIKYNADDTITYKFVGNSISITGEGTITKDDITNSAQPSLCIRCEDRTKITDVSINSEGLIIGANAFESCTSLITVNVKHVTTFSDNAFLSCSSLTDVIYCLLDSPTAVSNTAFAGTSDDLRVYVPYDYAPDAFGAINVKFTKILNHECEKQTLQFTYSSEFSVSKDFLPSVKFTRSNDFFQTARVSPSQMMAESEIFSITPDYSVSKDFDLSILFSRSNEFLQTSEMTQSHLMTKSEHFGFTSHCSKSEMFMKSSALSQSENFAQSKQFAKTDHFSPSERASTSMIFDQTKYFSTTNNFELSKAFSSSSEFVNTNYFSISIIHDESFEFSQSGSFQETYVFSNTDLYKPTKEFAYSSAFVESSIFGMTSNFDQSNLLSKSDVFKETSEYSESNIFDASSKFSISRKFEESKVFSMSYEPSIPLKMSSEETQTSEYNDLKLSSNQIDQRDTSILANGAHSSYDQTEAIKSSSQIRDDLTFKSSEDAQSSYDSTAALPQADSSYLSSFIIIESNNGKTTKYEEFTTRIETYDRSTSEEQTSHKDGINFLTSTVRDEAKESSMNSLVASRDKQYETKYSIFSSIDLSEKCTSYKANKEFTISMMDESHVSSALDNRNSLTKEISQFHSNETNDQFTNDASSDREFSSIMNRVSIEIQHGSSTLIGKISFTNSNEISSEKYNHVASLLVSKDMSSLKEEQHDTSSIISEKHQEVSQSVQVSFESFTISTDEIKNSKNGIEEGGEETKKSQAGLITGVVIGIIVVIIIIALIIIFMLKNRKKSDTSSFSISMGDEDETMSSTGGVSVNEMTIENLNTLEETMTSNADAAVNSDYDYEYFEELVPVINKFM